MGPTCTGRAPENLAGVEVFDLSDCQPAAQPKTRIRGGETVARNPGTIDTIVLHQTAVEFGTSRAAVRAAGGDAELAQRLRALNVGSHALAFREGWVVIQRTLRSYSYHANGLNRRSLGLEIEGNYRGLADDPRTVWSGARPSGALDELTVATARAAVSWLVRTGRALGMPLRFIAAHRQSSPTRRADPGEEIWRRVALEHAVAELGLETVPGRTWGEGRPIPIEWQPDGVGNY